MAYVRTERCDLCKGVQTSEKPADIKGTVLTVNHTRKFICGDCQIVFDEIFRVGAERLRENVREMRKLLDRVNWLETEKRGLEGRLKHKVEETKKERLKVQEAFEKKLKNLENEVERLSRGKPSAGERRTR